MPDELSRALARFPDAVLTGRTADGGPASVRCRPVLDGDVLRVPAIAPHLVDGPASVLFHGHDENLWSLWSLLVRGDLDSGGTVFRPVTLVPGTGTAGPLGDLRTFVAARRRAGRYLARRGLERPRIPWTRFRELP